MAEQHHRTDGWVNNITVPINTTALVDNNNSIVLAHA
jgi:hypothetical protein